MHDRANSGSASAATGAGFGLGSRLRPRSANLTNMLARAHPPAGLRLKEDGAQLFARALDEAACISLEAALAALPTGMPGVRMRGERPLEPLLNKAGAIGGIAATALGFGVRPVRAILFDKTAERNWAARLARHVKVLA